MGPTTRNLPVSVHDCSVHDCHMLVSGRFGGLSRTESSRFACVRTKARVFGGLVTLIGSRSLKLCSSGLLHCSATAYSPPMCTQKWNYAGVACEYSSATAYSPPRCTQERNFSVEMLPTVARGKRHGAAGRDPRPGSRCRQTVRAHSPKVYAHCWQRHACCRGAHEGARDVGVAGVCVRRRAFGRKGPSPNRPTRSERTLGVLERFGTLRQRRAAVRDESKRQGKMPKGA